MAFTNLAKLDLQAMHRVREKLVGQRTAVMNQIRASKSGRVARIFVENATPVEFGEPLLIIE